MQKRFKKLDLLFLISFILLIIAGVFLRIYKIDTQFGFLADQARDLLAMREWFVTGNLPLRGPSTSIGNSHLGPIYYYLTAPFYLIFNGDPFGVVLLNLFGSIGVLIVGGLFFYKNLGKVSALIFILIAIFSPHLIHLGRGSWNPNLQPLLVILILFNLMSYMKNERIILMFLTGVIYGIGVQLHYTFGIIILPILLTLFLFKRKIFLNWKALTLGALGICLPLVPFLIGQYFRGYEDFNNLKSFLNKNSSFSLVFFRESLISKLNFVYQIYFPIEKLPWYFSLFVIPVCIFILFSNFYIAFTKNHLNKITLILLIFFLSGLLISVIKRIYTYWHYTANFSIVFVLLIVVVVSYLFQYGKIKFIWVPVLGFFLLMEIYMVPGIYQIQRSPQIVYKVSDWIYNTQLNKKEQIKIFVISPVTKSIGLEYRYSLERKGMDTLSTNRPEFADFLIIEDSKNNSLQNILRESTNKIVIKKADFRFSDSTVVNSVSAFKLGIKNQK